MKNKSLLKNFMYKILLNIFNIFLPLLTIPYIYRLFEPKIMGEIEFTQSIMNYFFIFAGFGIYTYGLREVSKVRDNKIEIEKLFSELFLISTLSSILVLSIYLAYIFFEFNSDILLKNLLLINSISIFSCIFYIEWINEAFENYGFITKKTMFVKVISVICIFIFLKKNTDFYKYLLIINGTIFLNNILSFLYIRKNIKLSFENLSLKKYLFPLFIIVLINNINILYTNLDKITLGFYTLSSEVAYYGIGQKVMTIILMIIMTAISISIPRLSYYLGNDEKEYILLLNRILKYISCLIFPMSIGIYVLKEEISIFFGGYEYIAASSVVGMFGIRMIILAYESILSNQVMFLHKKEKAMAIILGICGILNIIFKFILIKKLFGLEYTSTTAILTTMLAEILIIFLNLLYIKKYLNLKIEIFSKNMIIYLFISLIFIPIGNIIKSYNLYYIYTALIIFILCSILYFVILIFIKDDCILEVLQKVKSALKRK